MNGIRIYIIVSLFLLNFNVLHAQLGAASYKDKDMQAFFNTKTFFVASGDEKFDDAVKEAMVTEWKVTPAGFMSHVEYLKNRKNSEYSFVTLIKIDVTTTNSKGQSYTQTHHFYGLLPGGKSDYSYSDMLAYCPLNYYMDENPMELSAYRIPVMIRNLNNTITLVKENQLKGNTLKIVNGLRAIYKKRAGVLKNKTLLVNKEHIKFSEEKFKKLYPYKFEFCSKEKIAQAIKSHDKNYCVFQPGVTLNTSMMVFDMETYDCIYFNYRIQGLKVKHKDISRLVKAIKKG